MNKELRLLWFRNIRKNKIQFITIMSIMFLSISFLLGLLSTSEILKKNVDAYFKDTKLYDLKLVSYGGFSDEYLDKIKSLPEISKVDALREEDLWLEKKYGKKVEAKVIYKDKFESKNFYLLSGKMPKNNEEILLAVGNTIVEEPNLNETIYIDKDKYGNSKTYKVVGIVLDPQLLSLRGEATTVGSGLLNNIIYAYRDENSGYDSLNIYLNKYEKNSVFSKEYEKKVESIDKKIKEIDKDRLENLKAYDIATNPYITLPWTVSRSLELNGITSFKNDIEKVGAIAKIFPIFFFLVGFLVVTTSMTKVIDENRKDIGTLRSLGYSKNIIYVFYVTYAFVIGLIASVIAVPVGFEVFPKVIGKAYSTGYNLPKINTIYLNDIFLPLVIISIFILIITVLYVTSGILREKTSELFLDKETKNIKNKRILIERISFIWSRLSFQIKVNTRNIFLFKKRMLMMILGISGCFALILTSFGLKDSISSIVSKQYSKIYTYDLRISLNKENNVKFDNYIAETLQISNIDASIFTDSNNKKEKGIITVIKDEDKIDNFINLYDEADKNLDFDKNGVYISQKLGELYSLKIGDNIKLEIKDKNYYFRVAGIFQNYVGHQLIVKESYYEKITAKTPVYKSLYANFDRKYSDKEIEEKIKDIMEDEDVLYALSTKLVKNTFEDSVDNLDYIIIVMNISAGLLSFVILYNLSNINIMERKKELATLKVLGFLPLEIRRYIFREINGLSILGIIFGFPLGILLHRFVILKTEVGGMMLDRGISMGSYLLSVVITLTFIVINNMCLRKKINNINMIEAMKAND